MVRQEPIRPIGECRVLSRKGSSLHQVQTFKRAWRTPQVVPYLAPRPTLRSAKRSAVQRKCACCNAMPVDWESRAVGWRTRTCPHPVARGPSPAGAQGPGPASLRAHTARAWGPLGELEWVPRCHRR